MTAPPPPYSQAAQIPAQPNYYPPTNDQKKSGHGQENLGFQSQHFSQPPPPTYGFVPPSNSGNVDNETYSRNNDPESGGMYGHGFNDKIIRQGFVRKVYSILTIQLLFTFAIVASFMFIKPLKVFLVEHILLYYVAYCIFFVTYLILVCIESARRKHPLNLIMLLIFTAAMSFMVGCISLQFDVRSILYAIGITAIVTFSVTLFSMQTKYDFTKWIGVLFVASMALFLFGILAIFTYSQILYTIYAGFGAVLFSIFLAVDTQLIMGGKKHQLSADDYILGSILLYIDVVYIFLFILSLIGKN